MRVRRARTSWVTSLTILDFCFGGMLANHLASRTLPCRETSRTYSIWYEDTSGSGHELG